MVVNKTYYSSVAQVKAMSGFDAKKLKVNSDVELDSLIEGYLFSVKDIIDQHCRKNFSEFNTYFATTGNLVGVDLVPASVHLASALATCNLLTMIVTRRESRIMKIDEKVSSFINREILSDDIKSILAPYAFVGVPF